MSENKEDYRILYTQIRYSLSQDDLDPRSLIDTLESEINSFEVGNLSLEQSHAFVNSHLPIFVKMLLERKYYQFNIEVPLRLNSFFKKILLLCIRNLKPEYFGLLDMLKKILDEEKSFYDTQNAHRYEIERILTEKWEAEKKNQVGDSEFLDKYEEVPVKHKSWLSYNIFYSYNLNTFVIFGGIQKIIDFTTADPHPSVDQIYQLTRLIISIFNKLDEQISRKTSKEFLTKSMKTVENLTADELRLTQKQDLQNLIKALEKLWEIRGPPIPGYTQKMGKILENFELNLAMVCLRSPYLEKKIYGIEEIQNKITQARHKDEEDARLQKGGYAYKTDYMDTARWLTTERLLEYLDNQNILELIFGPSSHPEIVKRSKDPIRLFYTNNRFARSQIDLIWNSASTKHEAEKDAIMLLIQDVIPVFSNHDLQYFFQKLGTISYEDIDSNVLSLIKSITKNMSSLKPYVKHGKSNSDHNPRAPSPEVDLWGEDNNMDIKENKPEFIEIKLEETSGQNSSNFVAEETSTDIENIGAENALDFLWSLCQESAIDGGISKSIAKETLTILQELLTTYFKSERVKYMVRCVENIKKNTIVLSSCQLLEQILRSYISSRMSYSSSESRDSKILYLAKEHNLISELYISLIKFKREAVDIAQNLLSGDEKPEEETNSTCSSGDEEPDSRKKKYEHVFNQIKISKDIEVSYIEEIKLRLEFLKYLYANSTENLTQTQVGILWDALILNAGIEAEHEECFDWILNGLPHWSGDYNIIDDDVIHFIYTDMLLKLDPRSYSPTGYRCFESYFININKQHGLIEKSEWSEDYDINDISLLGIQALWELILQARNDTVYRNAQNLFKRLFKGLRKNSLEMQQNFLKNCMNHIKSGAELLRESYNIDPVNRISRSLSLLYECIQDFEAKLIIKPTYKGDPIEVQIDNRTYLAENPKFFTIILYQEMTVGQALTLISNIIKPQIPVADLMIISKGKNLNEISEITSLNDLDISLKSTFVVYDRKEHENPSTPVLDYQVDPESLENLSGIFVGENEKLLILALKKAGGSVQEAVEILFDEESKAKLLENMTEIEPVEPVKYKITEDSTLSMIISNTQEYFNLLFELFELGNTTINIQIWTLLNKIPVNQEMYDNIKNLKIENDWNSLLDSTYMYKLLYSLQIVNSLLAQEDHMESIKWKAKFVEISGFSHIYKILMDADHLNLLSEQYQTHAKCIGVLLNLVKSFVESAMNRKIENPNDVWGNDTMDIDTINLNQEITDLIIKEIDFPVLISKLMDLVNVNIQRPQDNESFVLIERALDLLSSVLIYTPEFLEFFYSNPSLQGLIMSGLLDNPYQPIREAIKNTISILIETIHETTGVDLPRSFFLTVLINNLTKETSLYCDEYFELLNRLVYICHYNDLELLNRCLEVIIYREIKENRTIGNQDKVITGHLRLASTLIELIPDIKTNLSVYVEYFYMFLFDIPTTIDKNINQPPKFKHLDTRKAGFGLLLSLCASCHSNMQILIDKLYQNHPDNKYYANLDSGITLRSKTSYVGLKNFGSTCYMNSLMQQFYMIPALRNGLLDSKISISQQSEDNLLFQLQNLMANLSESEKEYYEPGGFTIAFKDFEGNSMNVSVQQDVDEFFNLLCDRLEEILKNTQNAKLFRNTIGGSLVHEIVSCEENLPYRGEREEQFLRISLDIKNKKNLAEALDLYIKEDTLEGDNKYFCDLYNQKITAKKRCLLYSMSNTVFIHLKRFDFDFTRMVRHKINDYFEFPMELNLKPWTKDGVENVNDKPNSYYQYELKGVLVHSGSAESGHYYSFIKDRKTENWLKFDDRNVDYFNIDHLKEETFGGDSNNGWSSSGQYYQFTKSAYMLIYERINPLEISEDLDIDESNYICKKSEIFSKIWTENMEFLRDMLLFDENYYDFIKSVIENYDFGVSSDYLPVMSESRNLIYERGFTNFILMEPSRIQMSPQEIFDSPEYRELYKLMETEAGNIDQLESSDYALKAIKIATLFSYELLIRAKNYSAFRTLTVLLTLLYRKNGHACLWFIKYLAQNSTLFIEVLFECKDPQVRFDFSELLSHVLVHTSCIELQILHVNENIININQLPSYKYPVTALTEDLYFKRSKSATGRFIEQYLHYYLQEARKNWRRFNEFFNVLKGFVSAGVNQTRIVVDKGGIYNLLSLYMNGVSPFLDKTIMGDQATDPDLDEVLEILKILICSSKTQGMQLTRTYPPWFMNENEQNESLIDGHTESFFQDQRVLKQLIMNIRNISVTTMLLHLTWQNMSQSEAIITEVLAKIVEFRSIYNEINVYLKLLFKLFTMKDSISHDRIIKFLDYKVHSGIGISPNSFFEVVYRYKDQHTMFTILIILWWGDLLANKHIYDAAQPYYHRYKWMLPFINCIGFNKYIPQKYPVDYAGSVRNVIEDLHKLVIRFDPQNSSDSESSVEIEIGPEDEFPNNDLEPEPSPKEIKEEESTESD